jgi:hypothetical protein
MKINVRLVLVGSDKLPYVVAKEPIMRNDFYLTTENTIVKCVGGETRKQLENCLKVMVHHFEFSNDDYTQRRMDEILVNGGIFELEVEDEFSNPKGFENVPWGDGLPRPIFINNKVRLP